MPQFGVYCGMWVVIMIHDLCKSVPRTNQENGALKAALGR
jgi:hypothetical protein